MAKNEIIFLIKGRKGKEKLSTSDYCLQNGKELEDYL